MLKKCMIENEVSSLKTWNILVVFGLICLCAVGYATQTGNYAHEDYYKTGTLNWQSVGSYNKHVTLFVNVDNEGKDKTFCWIGHTTEIENLCEGDTVSIRLAYNKAQCRYYVVDITKTEGVASEA